MIHSIEWVVVVIADNGTPKHLLSTPSRTEADQLARAIRGPGKSVKIMERETQEVPWRHRPPPIGT